MENKPCLLSKDGINALFYISLHVIDRYNNLQIISFLTLILHRTIPYARTAIIFIYGLAETNCLFNTMAYIIAGGEQIGRTLSMW